MQLFRIFSSHLARPMARDCAAKARVVVAAAALAAIVWGVHGVYQTRQEQYRHQTERELHTIHHLQAERIAQWREQRLADAMAFSEDALLAQALTQWRTLPTPANEALLTKRLRIAQELARYSAAYVLDTQGRLLLSAQGRIEGRAPQAEQLALQTAFAQAQASAVEPHYDPFFYFPFFSALAPIFQDSEPIGAVWLVSDVRTDLYPLIEKWPTASPSAESSIVVRSGPDVLFLSPLRHRENAALTFRISTTRQDDPTVQAVQGARGIFYAQDYRNTPVMAAASAVPGSTWFLVSKIDTDEAFANAKKREVVALSLPISLGLLCAGLVFAALQRRGRLREQALKIELQRNMLWLEGAQKTASMGYFAYDISTQAFTLSPMARTIFGWEADSLVPLHQWASLVHPECRKKVLALHEQALALRRPLQMQYRICRASDQQTRWVQVWADYETDPSQSSQSSQSSQPPEPYPQIARMTGTVQDITERKQTEQELADHRAALEQKVLIDPLTQIANRRALDEHVSTQWQRALDNRSPLSLMMIDIDHFKRYNDRYGHIQGDKCLKHVAHTLAAMVSRADELVARYGGEEFAVLLPGIDALQALEMAQKMCASMRALGIEHADSPTAKHVTISIGVASVQPMFYGSQLAPKLTTDARENASAEADAEAAADAEANAALAQALEGLAPQALFEQADAALYAAKQQGRNRAVFQSEQEEENY